MTTSNDAKAKLTPKIPKNPTKPSPRVKNLLYALIALSALLGLFFYALYLQSGHQQTQQSMTAIFSELKQLKVKQVAAEAHVDAVIKAFSTKQHQIEDAINKQGQHLQALLAEQSYQAEDWHLQKARYFLELAEINAHWSEDPQTTITLLHEADAILANIHDQRLFPIREALAKESTNVNASPKKDLTGILARLTALQNTIADLPLKSVVLPEEKSTTPQTNQNIPSSWQKHFTDSLKLLEKLVVVQRHNEDILPIPSKFYESMLREAIRLNLEEAQWALLQNNEAIYQFSLTQAVKNIQRCFQPNDPKTTAFREEVQSLQTIHLITKDKPIALQSLQLLNQLIASKNQAVNENTGAKKP